MQICCLAMLILKKVAVIDNAEMKNTKGESFLGLAIVAGVTWLGTCFFGECSVDVDLDIRLSW